MEGGAVQREGVNCSATIVSMSMCCWYMHLLLQDGAGYARSFARCHKVQEHSNLQARPKIAY